MVMRTTMNPLVKSSRNRWVKRSAFGIALENHMFMGFYGDLMGFHGI